MRIRLGRIVYSGKEIAVAILVAFGVAFAIGGGFACSDGYAPTQPLAADTLRLEITDRYDRLGFACVSDQRCRDAIALGWHADTLRCAPGPVIVVSRIENR